MSEKTSSKNKKEQKKSRVGIVLRIAVLVLLSIALLGVIGVLGNTLRGFFLGVFGFSAYAILPVAIVLYVLFGFGLIRKKPRVRTILFTIGLVLLLALYLQIFTSSEIDLSSFSLYVRGCYSAALGTSGGWLIGLIAYPLLSLMGKYSMILVAVLFFVVLFFALFPMMRGAKPKASPERAQTEPRPVSPMESVPRKSGVKLFVDKVRPGQKDAQKIKMKGWFAKKGPEPTFFDYRDTRPLYAPEGIIPEVAPERFDRYAAGREEPQPVRGAPYDEEIYRSPEPQEFYRKNPEPTYDREDDFSRDDMPAFVRRYAGERAEAKRRLYGDDSLSMIPEEPRFEKKAEASEERQEQPTATKSAPTQAPVRPTPRFDGIIHDMSDLERIRAQENSAPKRDPFIGEKPSAEPTKKDVVEEKTIEREDLYKQSSTSPDLFDDPFAEGGVTKEETKSPLFEKQGDSNITPRDASGIEPIEAKAKPTFDSPISKVQPVLPERKPPIVKPEPTADLEPTPEDRLSTRKPRSDIGGTHRTSESKPPFIPPQKMEQMDISQVEEKAEEPPARPYTAPPVTLLTDYPPIQDEEGVEERGEMLVQALASFNIASEVVDHKTGPTFTQFAVTLPDNMSVNKLMTIEKDIKRKMRVEKNIRIISSVPGLDAVGIEVPNQKTSMVGLRSIINSPDFSKEGKLYFAIGVDVSGRAVYGDLLKMPHLLVAGSTGSGKSVCLNVMICSIMFHYSPEVVRFIMVDPKKVELSVYKNMPHMLMPSTVTEPDKAVNALSWAVNEMERRYQLLMENNCRNIGEYNALMKKTGGKRLYYIVFIVDEMADLMYAAKREIEEKVNRIAAKARAAGIHLVVATQRPSVDVITGTIKNNIPTRIAFKVTSFTDSKTILDRGGAEALFGNGDMLYVPPEGGDPIRLQGPYINDEIAEIVSYVKEHNDNRFDLDAERVIQADKEPAVEQQNEDNDNADDGEDPFFASALLYFINIGQASISKLQFKYRIGYGRAARIVETMFERGYLGPAEAGNKSRQVKITLEEYYELYGEDGVDGDEAK